MFDLDHWREILGALAANKMRTGLTAFGVFWGIFLLIVMLGSGHGLRNGVTGGFANGATNSFFVWGQSTSKPYRGLPRGRSMDMTNDDIVAVREHVPEASIIAPRIQLGGFGGGNNVTRGTKSGGFSVMGDYPEILVIQHFALPAGRFLNHYDLEERRKVAVIGTRVRDLLFDDGEDPISSHIEVNGVYFKVVGVFESHATGDQAERDEQTIFIPFTTFQNAFNRMNEVGWFAIASQPNVPASIAEEKVLNLLKTRHRVDPEDSRAFGHYNLEEEYQQIQGLFGGIGVLIWIVGIGTLAAGAIGVSNIMLIIVKERTKEIGIRRAIGAKPASIMSQVVLEAIVLTAVSGYFGLVAGVGVLELVNEAMSSAASNSMFSQPGVSFSNALQALTVLIVSGALAGVIPARRAVAISPVMALRSE